MTLQPALNDLKKIISRWTAKEDRVVTPISGLTLFAATKPSQRTGGMYELSICMVVQGAKQVLLGNETYTYNSENYLITSVDLPAIVQIIEASRENPFLGLSLKLDLREISQLMLDSNLPSPREQKTDRGMGTGTVSPQLLESFKRLLHLLDESSDIPILSPLIKREICYRLLTGDQGAKLRQIATSGSLSRQIVQAISWLKENYSLPLRIEDLANMVNMSKSSFHHHFRELTAMSPLQYQKILRLNEARRLMLAERLDASTAAFNVGYESPSQFNREYSRHFGAPPLRDISSLREAEF